MKKQDKNVLKSKGLGELEKDLKEKQVILVRRDTNEKEKVKFTKLKSRIKKLLINSQHGRHSLIPFFFLIFS